MFTKNRFILIFGLLVALMPFLGFPIWFETFFYVVAGLSVATLSFLIARHKRLARMVKRVFHKKEKPYTSFEENTPVEMESSEEFIKEEGESVLDLEDAPTQEVFSTPSSEAEVEPVPTPENERPNM